AGRDPCDRPWRIWPARRVPRAHLANPFRGFVAYKFAPVRRQALAEAARFFSHSSFGGCDFLGGTRGAAAAFALLPDRPRHAGADAGSGALARRIDGTTVIPNASWCGLRAISSATTV